MNNIRIRVAMIQHNLKQWELAEKMGTSEASLSRMLRHELPEDEQSRIIKLIEGSNTDEES